MNPNEDTEAAITIVVLLLVLYSIVGIAIATLFYHKGKNWFGSATHPAAVFILACFAFGLCSMVIPPFANFTFPFSFPVIGIGYLGNYLLAKIRNKNRQPDGDGSNETKEENSQDS